MTADEMRANFEYELAWRQEEVAFFKNHLNYIADEKKDCYRKSLVLILYSHLEGYVKICMQTYIQYLNSLNLQRCNVNANLQASSMHQVFKAYDNLDRKCSIFRKVLPDDRKLHRFSRRVELIEKFDDFKQDVLFIDDLTVDTESNLWYVVLQKNLFNLGLPIDMFDKQGKRLDDLVNRRNSIAHGNFRSGVSEMELDGWISDTYKIMNDITRLLYEYAKDKKYLI